jgi:hypothetical protein
MSFSTIYRLVFLCFFVWGEDGNAQIQRFITADVQIRNFGFDLGMGMNSSWQPDDFSESYGLRIGNIQHPKEVFVVNQALPASEPFVMDKINRAWVLRPYYARNWILSQRKSRFDIGVALQGGVHLPVAYAWPIYVWVFRSNLPFDAVEEMRYDPQVHDVQFVGGESSYTRGFKEGKLIPGIGISAALSLEWGSYRNISNTLSIGVMNDYFVQQIPLLHSINQNPQNLPALFINFAVGFGGNR